MVANALKKEEEEEREETHNKLRNILIKYECEEFGDAIIDEICELFNYPKTK